MKKLTASEGHKLYDGNTVATEVCLPDTADESVWKEITDEEANKIKDEKEKILQDSIKQDFIEFDNKPETDID